MKYRTEDEGYADGEQFHGEGLIWDLYLLDRLPGTLYGPFMTEFKLWTDETPYSDGAASDEPLRNAHHELWMNTYRAHNLILTDGETYTSKGQYFNMN